MWRSENPALVALDPRVLALEGAFYAPGNTASGQLDFTRVSVLTQADDLDALFAGPWSRELVDWQAEIWIPGGVPADFIRAVFVTDRAFLEELRPAIVAMNVEQKPDVIVDPHLYGDLPYALGSL